MSTQRLSYFSLLIALTTSSFAWGNKDAETYLRESIQARAHMQYVVRQEFTVRNETISKLVAFERNLHAAETVINKIANCLRGSSAATAEELKECYVALISASDSLLDYWRTARDLRAQISGSPVGLGEWSTDAESKVKTLYVTRGLVLKQIPLLRERLANLNALQYRAEMLQFQKTKTLEAQCKYLPLSVQVRMQKLPSQVALAEVTGDVWRLIHARNTLRDVGASIETMRGQCSDVDVNTALAVFSPLAKESEANISKRNIPRLLKLGCSSLKVDIPKEIKRQCSKGSLNPEFLYALHLLLERGAK